MRNIKYPVIKMLVLLLLVPQLSLAADDHTNLLYQLREKIAGLFLSLEQLQWAQFAQVLPPNASSSTSPILPPPGSVPIETRQLLFDREALISNFLMPVYEIGTIYPSSTRAGTLGSNGKSYATFIKGNARPPKINLAKNTYFITSELPADSTVPIFKRIASSSRSELEFDQNIVPGTTYYLEFDVFIDKVSDVAAGSSSDWRLVQQIIEETANKSPVISMNLSKSGNFEVVRRTRDKNYSVLVRIPATKGVWHRFAYQFTLGNSGRMSIWHNGIRIYHDSRAVTFTQCPGTATTTVGASCGGFTQEQASVKFGIYRSFMPPYSLGHNKVFYKDIMLNGFRL